MQVPEAVIKAAGGLVDKFGANFKHLGDYDGQDAWLFVFPGEQYTGYPFVYLVKDGEADEISGEFALDIACHFTSNKSA